MHISLTDAALRLALNGGMSVEDIARRYRVPRTSVIRRILAVNLYAVGEPSPVHRG